MKALLVLPLLLTLASCKYDSLDKVIVGAGIKVEVQGNKDNTGCLDKQLNSLNYEISRLKKPAREQVVALLKSKLDRIVLVEDSISKKIRGVKSSLSQVTQSCYNSSCWWTENATKNLKDETKIEGQDPLVKVTVQGRDLSIQAEELKDMSVHKKYYTRSVQTYDVTDDLEAAINDRNIWNEPTPTGDRSVCAKPISLEQFLAIING